MGVLNIDGDVFNIDSGLNIFIKLDYSNDSIILLYELLSKNNFNSIKYSKNIDFDNFYQTYKKYCNIKDKESKPRDIFKENENIHDNSFILNNDDYKINFGTKNNNPMKYEIIINVKNKHKENILKLKNKKDIFNKLDINMEYSIKKHGLERTDIGL